MKSQLIEAGIRDESGGSLHNWKRLVLDREEFVQALKENNLQGLVTEILRPTHGDLETFHHLVGDCVKGFMLLLTGLLEKHATGKPSCIFNDVTVWEHEEHFRKLAEKSKQFIDTCHVPEE